MASLVESASDLLGSVDEDRMRYMAFSEAMLAAEEFASPLYDFHEETWHELYVRPSPPVTPSCLSPTPAAPVVPPDLDRNGLDMAEALLCNIMEYEQVMDALHDAEFALSSSQTPDDMLIQDCMWSGSTCEETKGNSGAVDDKAILQPDSSNCIEPAVVFPSLTSHVSTEPQSVSIPESTRSVSLRLPSAGSLQSDGSEEEIDVVTVEHRNDHHHHHHHHHHHKTSSHYATANGTLKSSNSKQTKKTITSQNGALSNQVGAKPGARKRRGGKRQQRVGNMEGTESEEDARRASHNVLERKRRNDLKNSFDILRMGIPDLEENVRAPKVVILRKAVEYIKSLQTTDKKYDNEILKEQKRFNRLKDRLSQLRSSFPATL